MAKLLSEQLPNDGGYRIPELVTAANKRLGQLGKHGKRAKIAAKKTSLTLQFTFKDGNGNSQKQMGLGAISASANGVLEAEKIAQMVTNQLTANAFTWDWFNSLIGKDTSEQNKQLTCKEMVEEYKKHYFKQKKDNKSPKKSWYSTYRNIENMLDVLDKPLSLSLIKQTVEITENNSVDRKNVLNGLAAFLKYFDNHDYKKIIKEYKANNKIKRKPRNVPSDNKIIEIYQLGFKPNIFTSKKYLYRFPQWQFLYGLLATYGLRIHEAWNIANWDKPVIFKKDDWVTIDVDEKNSIELQRNDENLVIPAILDPNNKEYILCIKHDTKTGYRMAMPISPEGHNWIEEFDLLQPFNLPDIPNPLKRIGETESTYLCATSTCGWFLTHKYGFTAHDLRHAYVHRGHQLGYNPKALADSGGHSIKMSSTTYLRDMSLNLKHQGIISSMTKEQNKRSRVEELEAQVNALETELLSKDNEIELLKTKLMMYEAIEESKGQK